MKTRLCALVLCLPWLAAAGAQDGPAYTPCLDTWAINSNAVFVAKITEVCSPSRCGSDNTVSLKVERTLKGDEGTQFKLQIDAPPEALKDWKHRKSSLLLFDGLDVDPLSTRKAPAEVLDLSDPALSILTAHMQVLRDPDEILAAASAAIGQHPDGKHLNTFPRMLLNESLGLNNGFPPLTLVPVDPDLERWAQSVLLGPPHPAIDAALRPEAVRALQFFPSDSNTRLLRTLLDDPASTTRPAEFNLGVEVRTYPVRTEAYTVLREWKVNVAEPVTHVESSQPEAVRTASLSNRTGIIGHAEIEQLARFGNLQQLELQNDHLTAQAYKSITRLNSLRAISLGGSNITDGKLDNFVQLTHLEALDLTATKITDAGLQPLAQLPELKSLNLTQTRATAQGVRQLQQQRPDIVIRYR